MRSGSPRARRRRKEWPSPASAPHPPARRQLLPPTARVEQPDTDSDNPDAEAFGTPWAQQAVEMGGCGEVEAQGEEGAETVGAAANPPPWERLYSYAP